MVILGLDPGTTRIGYGVIRTEGTNLTRLASGLLGGSLVREANQFVRIEKALLKIIKEFNPDRVGVEKLFFAKNKKTALEVAETRGVILNVIAKKNLPLVELSPTAVKLAVAGDGRASKKAVAKMVRYFLRLPPEKTIDDVSDALAIAIASSRREPNSSRL